MTMIAPLNMDFARPVVVTPDNQTRVSSPHLSKHDPYVEEETLILVKTGHLPTT